MLWPPASFQISTYYFEWMNTEKHLNAVYLVKCEIPKIKSILKMDPIYFLDEKKPTVIIH